MHRLKEVRTKNGYSQQLIADYLSVARSTVAMWETENSEPDIETLKKLASYYQVSVDYLLGASDSPETIEARDILDSLRAGTYPQKSKAVETNAESCTPPSFFMTQFSSFAFRVPVFGTVPAGIPIEAIEDIFDYEEIPREMTAGGREYFGLRVKGDSMEPEYRDGDTILIIKQNDCDNGQIAVIYVNGFDATLKRVVKTEDSIILQPLNPAYDPMVYRLDDPDNPVTILGVVVEIRRKV